MTKISNAMSKKVVFIDVDAKITAALSLMQGKKIRHLPVVDGDHLIGILSDRDIQRAMKTEIKDIFSAGIIETAIDPSLAVRDFMSWPVKSLDVNVSLKEACDLFVKNKISSAVVVENDDVAGILTTEDLLKVLAHMLSHEELTLREKVLEVVQNTPIGKIADLLSNTGI